MSSVRLSKEVLLDNLQSEGKYIRLDNDYVTIIISTFNSKFVLESFYNKRNIKHIARCGLMFLLEEMVDGGMMDHDTNMYVKDIWPSDGTANNGAYQKLIRIYQSIGFKIDSGQIVSRNVVMVSTVGQLVRTLKNQCELFERRGGKTRRKKTTKRHRKTYRRLTSIRGGL
jgi:hypothetical protein